MKKPASTQMFVDYTVDKILTGTADPRALWLEEMRRQKRKDGHKYYNPAAVLLAEPQFVSRQHSIAENADHGSHYKQTEVLALERKIRFLEMQLESHRPYLQLYRLGAASLFIAILSIVVWLITGIGIPFHPVFAGVVVVPAIGVMVMAFLIRPRKKAK
jgi:hypothetical protein